MPDPADQNQENVCRGARRFRSASARALLVLVCLGFVEPFAVRVAFSQQGDSAPVTPPLPGTDGQPLAACRVSAIKVRAASAPTSISGSLLIDTPMTDDPMLDYLPLPDPTGPGLAPPDAAVGSDAAVGGESEQSGEDSRVRVLVAGPAATRVIDFRVLIDGRPFRQQRRAWIDELIRRGPAERQLRDAGRALSNAAAVIGEAAKIESLSPDATRPRRRLTPTLRDRLANYLAAVGAGVDRGEITALLNQWPSGPALTVLSPGRSWQRLNDAPLLNTLDADGDDTLSPAEVSAAGERLLAADVDQDGVVQITELQRSGRRRSRRARAGRLVVLVDPGGEWRRKLGRDADRVDLDRIATGPPDLEVVVRYGSGAAVELLAASGVETGAIVAGDAALSVDYGSECYEIAAVTPAETTNEKIDQVAIGAAFDGRPLLRLLDSDNDQRLTIQEQRRLPDLLRSLDRDGDGGVDGQEVPAPLRIVVGRGAIVHETLAAAAAAVKPFESSAPRTPAPDWFLPMDVNRDGVLTRDEFPGGADQFQALDTDGDGLISASEAAAMEA